MRLRGQAPPSLRTAAAAAAAGAGDPTPPRATPRELRAAAEAPRSARSSAREAWQIARGEASEERWRADKESKGIVVGRLKWFVRFVVERRSVHLSSH